jgi:hypothetical protein
MRSASIFLEGGWDFVTISVSLSALRSTDERFIERLSFLLRAEKANPVRYGPRGLKLVSPKYVCTLNPLP